MVFVLETGVMTIGILSLMDSGSIPAWEEGIPFTTDHQKSMR